LPVPARRLRTAAPTSSPPRTFQRFGAALNVNFHFHALVLDGVHARSQGTAPRFHPLPPPSDREVADLVRALTHRLARLLERRALGRATDPADADPFPRDQPLLAALYAESTPIARGHGDIGVQAEAGGGCAARAREMGGILDVDAMSPIPPASVCPGSPTGGSCTGSNTAGAMVRPAWSSLPES
jgi:hypothetical protein